MTQIESFWAIKSVPLQKLDELNGVSLYMKRADLIHSVISGNKFWKLYHNFKCYCNSGIDTPMIITFGGAYSNHILATAYAGYMAQIPTLGIIRGEELENVVDYNPTLSSAKTLGMKLHFVNREMYRDKKTIEKAWREKYPQAMILPEGGTNSLAVEGIKNMLDTHTEDFDYLCSAVGTGGTISGLSKYAREHQQVVGFMVAEDEAVLQTIDHYTDKDNLHLVSTAPKGYGKFDEKTISFINHFYQKYQIPLDPVYTGKMMMKLLELIEEGFFPAKSKILVFHTGGVQGVLGANALLNKKNKLTIDFNPLTI